MKTCLQTQLKRILIRSPRSSALVTRRSTPRWFVWNLEYLHPRCWKEHEGTIWKTWKSTSVVLRYGFSMFSWSRETVSQKNGDGSSYVWDTIWLEGWTLMIPSYFGVRAPGWSDPPDPPRLVGEPLQVTQWVWMGDSMGQPHWRCLFFETGTWTSWWLFLLTRSRAHGIFWVLPSLTLVVR